MKIRIKDNTIRLRLAQSEVSAIGQGGQLSSRTEFPGASLSYLLETNTGSEFKASFNGSAILISVPEHIVGGWHLKEDITLTGVAGELTITMEKDFECITNRDEDKSDLFPNPNRHC